MFMLQWLSSRLLARKPKHWPRARRVSHSRLQLEALEDRAVLSTLTVINPADSGAGSLRSKVAAAHPGDTIVFAPSLTGHTITLTSGEIALNKPTITGPGVDQRNNNSRISTERWYSALITVNISAETQSRQNGRRRRGDRQQRASQGEQRRHHRQHGRQRRRDL